MRLDDFCEERADQAQTRIRDQETLFLKMFRLESASVQITSVDGMRGHMIRCRPQACRFTSRREDSRRAMTHDGFYFT